jgi:hypothetical protein
MVSLAQLWLPILLSAVFVFIASSILHMVLKFWHMPDCKPFSNQDEIGAAMRKGNADAGMYMLPYCTPETMKKPETKEMFVTGPVGMVVLRPAGPMNIGAYLGQWFVYCVVISFLSAFLAWHVLGNGTPFSHVFHIVTLAAFLGYAMGAPPNSIWWGFPWVITIKHVIDGVIYALITGATFGWLWPA